MTPAVRVGQRHDLNVVASTSSASPVELVWADLDQALGVAVIGDVDRGDVRAARRGAGQAQRELVGLAAGVREEAHLEVLRKEADEAFGIPDDVLVEVARVRVED